MIKQPFLYSCLGLAEKLNMCMSDFYEKVTPEEIRQWQVYNYTKSESFQEWWDHESQLEQSKHMTSKQIVGLAMANIGVAKLGKKEDK